MNEKKNDLLLWYLLIEGCNWPSGEGFVHVGGNNNNNERAHS